jgi:1-acyl-sn-glycerol-3-phosphate acyltransferase
VTTASTREQRPAQDPAFHGAGALDGLPWAGGGAGKRLEALARTLGTGFLFAVFGLGAWLLASAVLPLIVRRKRHGAERELFAQQVLHRSFGWYIRLGSVLRLFSLSTRGDERLRGDATLVVANHPTLLDVVFLISCMPQADCIVKRQAWRNPFFRGIVTAAGYIPNDDGEAVVAECVARLRAGRSVILFPEGSRSPLGGLGPFKRGAAHIAQTSGAPITPVAIGCDPPALMKGQPWYALPNRKLIFSLAVGEPLHVGDLLPEQCPRAIAARRITAKLRSYFQARLGHEDE